MEKPLKPAIMRRIKWVVRMDERRIACCLAGNVDGLRQVAAEYAARNMLRTAGAVYRDIAELEPQP